MSATYDRRAARRRRERERDLCGETLAEYHARENPARTAPGAGIPHARDPRTFDLFGAQYEAPEARQGDMGFPMSNHRRTA